MASEALAEIERHLPQLSHDEQLLLIERLARQLRGVNWRRIHGDDLEAMASDPDFQRELTSYAEDAVRRSPYSIEELERRRKERTGKTLAEVREDLNKQGIPF